MWPFPYVISLPPPINTLKFCTGGKLRDQQRMGDWHKLMQIPSGRPGFAFYSGWLYSPRSFHCTLLLPLELFFRGQMAYFLSWYLPHRSLITVIQPGNSDVPHMCFVHKKNELFGVGGSNCHLILRNGKCKFTVEIYIFKKNIPYTWEVKYTSLNNTKDAVWNG